MNTLHQELARTVGDARLAAARDRHLAARVRNADHAGPRSSGRAAARWLAGSLARLLEAGRATSPAAGSRAYPPKGYRAQPAPTPAPAPRLLEPDDAAQEVALMLDHVAARIADHGTLSEAPVLAAMAALAERSSPGAAAALVDWDGAEVARLRAFGLVHGVVLAVLDPGAPSFVLGHAVGTDAALTG
ncbi:hypothetical protein EKO23_07155 [Nocardioides guangzhouensis]|uniref:Uncharacterized protein n=1 Tax=Nocardioides guangzhouensis TaxID=2497878 RepID=A0A4Q4ZHY5_9ACTN|nr:hypothetical protein [Nocardioides guangzhouensis]RYP87046.1 hypothetical protein EKO23_07155 [Nocardioides guangzhouensis]